MSSEIVPKSEDVRLACAFIPDADKRAGVLALYAFLETLREIPERVTEPLMGDIRFQWWREAIDDIEAGRTPRYHPLTEAIQKLAADYALPLADFHAMIDGQAALLEPEFLTLKTALSVVDSGEGMVARLAAQMLDPDTAQDALLAPARLAGLAALRARGLLKEAGETERAHLKRDAAAAIKTLPANLMPLALPAALATAIWRGQPLGPLAKRWTLFWSFISGQI